ncbi:MAG: hypothetical protein AB1896_18775, partial [Thermodesulfobacteriota bacterium]
VTLKILVSDFTLSKTYSGVNGYPDFLEEFRDGSRTFTPADFPERQAALEKMGVTEIKVTYIIEGAAPVQRLEQAASFPIPLSVARCWGY